VNIPIAAALDRGIELKLAIQQWADLGGDEAKYKVWVMGQPTNTFSAKVQAKLSAAPAGTLGICLNASHPERDSCSNRTEAALGVGARCRACSDGCGHMVNMAIAAAMDAGIEEAMACAQWLRITQIAGLSNDERNIQYAGWVAGQKEPCAAAYARKKAMRGGLEDAVCVHPRGRTGNPNCPGWSSRADHYGTDCHLCNGVLADAILAEAYDKLLPATPDDQLSLAIHLLGDNRRSLGEQRFAEWLRRQIETGSTPENRAAFADAVKTMINSGKAEEPLPSTKPEEANMATTNDKGPENKVAEVYNKVVKTAKKGAGSAAWRLAATQITELAKPMLIAALCKDIPDASDSYRKSIAEFFNTPAGEAFFRGFIGISLPFVPGIDGTLGENLAEEFRVSAMEKGGNVIAAHIVGPLVNVLTVAISQSTAMRALQAQATALPDSNGVTARVNFADATVTETASK
jgi:hypothetical protein